MQRCPNCGSMIPDNARFCSNCGHVPAAARNLTADEQNWSTVPESPLSEAPASGSGQPPVGNIPPAQNAFFSGPTQDLGPKPDSPPSSFAPSQTPPPAYGTQLPVQGGPAGPFPPGSNVPPRKPSRRILGIPLAWLLTILACLVVLAAGVGVFTAILRPRSSHPAGTPGAGTPTATRCANAKSCATPTKRPTSTPVVAGPTDLTFSGAVAGHMDNIKYSTCGVTNGGSQYNISLQGKIGGTDYNFVFRINPFKGPDNYNTGKIFGSLIQQPVSVTGTWINTGSQTASATVNSDKKTGAMNMDLAGQINTEHVTGSWSCP